MEATQGSEAQDSELVDEEAWLLGQPSLREYLDFVKNMAVDPAPDRAALAAEWRDANDYYATLEDREYGLADTVECRDLDARLAPLVEEVSCDPRFRRTFDSVPAHFALVELDKLVVYQKSVTWNFVQAVAARLGPSPDEAALFRLCLPLDGRAAPFGVRKMGSRRYQFTSDSTDFRFHEAALLRGEQIEHASFGPVAGVVALLVGHGSNFLNVVRYGSRIVLHNGYHRACALRSLGVTHAPCIVQTVTRADELDVAASPVARDPQFYFRTARPPLLKDYFDERIHKRHRVRRQQRVVEVSFEVRELSVHRQAR